MHCLILTLIIVVAEVIPCCYRLKLGFTLNEEPVKYRGCCSLKPRLLREDVKTLRWDLNYDCLALSHQYKPPNCCATVIFLMNMYTKLDFLFSFFQ